MAFIKSARTFLRAARISLELIQIPSRRRLRLSNFLASVDQRGVATFAHVGNDLHGDPLGFAVAFTAVAEEFFSTAGVSLRMRIRARFYSADIRQFPGPSRPLISARFAAPPIPQ